MKNKLSITYLVLIPLLFSCSGSVKNGNENKAATSSLSLHTGDDKYFNVNTKESVVTWTGASLMGANSHTGYVYLSQGELLIKNGQLLAGTLEVDMNTIEDKNHERDNKLVHHLKDPDFFDVNLFPFSTIAITKVVSIDSIKKKVTGNLTIKGITHPITFPAKIYVRNDSFKAEGRLVIDRSLWNVRYKSRKFYDLVANQTISDSLQFVFKIVARK